ncbi:Sialidase [Diplogelasinospora grovesii]|uniref:Sialidase n=1 Tax=Diplogelasinospora grovesii TaxID=303347 RepID=A0AAN6S7P8_9PEZI|nr:Sialidase [Diplogelasinospora grovesii]
MAFRLLSALTLLSGLVSSTPLSLDKRLLSGVQSAGSPVSIDPAGVYIRAATLNDGSLITGYAAQDGTQHVLRVARSTDGAQSWNDGWGEVWRADSATHEIDNAFPLVLPSGRVLYAFRNHDRTSAGVFTYYRITICYSDDGGQTFQFLVTVDERPANGVNGLWEPFMRLARDGTLQVFYSSENSANDQDNLMKYSRDGGQTWTGPITVSGGDTSSSRDGMTGVANIDGNGNLICVFENTEIGHFSIDRVLSHDDGYTWGERARVYTAANSRDAGAPAVVNVGGTLVVSFMTNEDTPSVTVGQVDGSQMKLVTSVNGGQGWSNSGGGGFVASDIGTHWPGLYAVNGNQFLALYSKDGLGAVSQLFQLV